MPAAEAVRVRVPAKVNLHLGVGARRADGYHELITVFHAVDLTDEVRVTAAAGLEVRVRGEGADALPVGSDNIAWRAAERLAAYAGVAPGALIEIDKRIPVAAGLAGGSADAAATLVACAKLWQTGTSRTELASLAAELGSDVAFPLVGGTALGTGRGEVLTPALTTGTFHWVLAVADFGVSTADAYAELDRQRADGVPGFSDQPDAVLDAVRAGDPHQLALALSNDLQAATLKLAPGLRDTLDAGDELGALAGIVSGSGPTVALLCADAGSAGGVAAGLRLSGLCRLTHVVRGPVAGARLVS
jgi:4-diphosphocytidyl-2-C-methyl-D-erythritol kinase